MSDSTSTGGPGGYGPAPPPLVASPPVVWPASESSPRPSEPPEPWVSIWSRPRVTLRHILETSPRRGLFRLAAIGGIAQCLAAATQPGFGDAYSIPVVVSVAIAGGALAGIVGMFIFSVLIGMTGRWLGGRGGMPEVMTALAWANVPAIWSLALWLPRAALLGEETFHSLPASIEETPPAALLFAVLQGIQAIIAVWAFVILLKCLGEAHAFSAWRALGALLLAALVLAVPIALMAILGLSLGR